MKKAASLLLMILLTMTMAVSQEALKSTEEEYYDFLSLQGYVERPTLGFRTLSDSVWTLGEDTDHVWKNNSLGTTRTLFSVENASSNWFLDGIDQSIKLRFYGPEWFNSYNKSVPFGFNDGALWQGVGYNTSFSTGVRLEGFGFELTFKPVITYSQNKEYDYLRGPYGGDYGYYADYAGIDLVQRYGNTSFQTFNWGDSEIRYTWHSFTVGFGTQTPWLGASYINPMLGSNNADPYLKFDVGLRKTPIIIPYVDWYLGDFEGRVWVGKLKESDYFVYPYASHHEDRMITMGSFSFSPAGDIGLTIGMNRLFLTYWNKSNLSYIKRLFTLSQDNGTGTGNDEDQKVSLFVNWLLPDSGFEVYGEFGIDDFSSNLFPAPFHTAIYTLGIKQTFNHSDSVKGMLNLEWNNSEMSQDYQMRQCYGGYYYHGAVSQGYTNNGQIIGAGTGSFGNSQYIAYTLYYPAGKTTLSAHRYNPDNNYILNKAVHNNGTGGLSQWYQMYKTILAGGIDSTFYISDSLSVSAGAKLIMDVFPDYTDTNGQWRTSFNVSFGAKYSF